MSLHFTLSLKWCCILNHLPTSHVTLYHPSSNNFNLYHLSAVTSLYVISLPLFISPQVWSSLRSHVEIFFSMLTIRTVSSVEWRMCLIFLGYLPHNQGSKSVKSLIKTFIKWIDYLEMWERSLLLQMCCWLHKNSSFDICTSFNCI